MPPAPCRPLALPAVLVVFWAALVEGAPRALLASRSVTHICRASAPPGSSGQSDEYGPRRALGSVDIDGRGVQHGLPSFGPFLFLEDALLPRGKMPPFGKHPHAGLLSLTLLLRGDCVRPWDNIRGDSALLRPGGMYVVDSATGIVHSEDRVVRNPGDTGTATHALFIWLDPGIFIREHLAPRLASSRVYLPTEIPEVREQGGMHVRVLLGRYLGRTAPSGHVHRLVLRVVLERRGRA
jgi:redox-sensitive bicupin YhaK (pirin superfamily)